MIGVVIEKTGDLPIALEAVREYLGVGSDAPADLLTELVGAASDLVQGPGSLTDSCFTPHVIAAAQQEMLDGQLEDWKLRLPGGPARGLGAPAMMSVAYGTEAGPVVIDGATNDDFYFHVDSWYLRVPERVVEAVKDTEDGIQRVHFSGDYAGLSGYVAVRYRSGGGTLPREVAVAIKEQVQSLWDLRGARLMPGEGDAKPNPMVKHLLRKYNANGVIP